MRPDDPSDELVPGRLFIHARLNDPMTGGPLYGRILALDGALVKYEQIYRRADGSERLGAPSAAGTSGPGRRRRLGKPLGVSRCRWTSGRSEVGQLVPEVPHGTAAEGESRQLEDIPVLIGWMRGGDYDCIYRSISMTVISPTRSLSLI